MAQAIVTFPDMVMGAPPTPGTGSTVNMTISAAIIGSDVGDGRLFDVTSLVVNFDPAGDTPAQIASKMAGAVRTYAASHGITIPTNSILVPSFTKG